MGPPLFGVRVNVAITRKLAGEESAVVPVAVTVKPGGTAPPPVAATVNVQPAAMFPRETEQVNGEGVKRLGGPTEFEIDTDVSAALNPEPVTVTTVPTGPINRERAITGPPVTVNVLNAVPPPPMSV